MSAAPVVAALITLIVAGVTVQNWRWGLLSVIFIGVLQDVLRKLTPDVPAYFTIWAFLIFVMVLLSAFLRGEIGQLNSIWFGDKKLKAAFQFFVALIVVQAVHALVRWGSPFVPAAGLVFYLGPFFALLLVIAFARQKLWVQRFLYVYLWVMVPTCLSVYLSFYFEDSFPVLRDIGSFVGLKLIIYDVGTVLYSYSGLLRVGEISAFHAATCIAFLTIFIFESNRRVSSKAGYVLLIIALLGAIILTGRRKMLMTVSLFWIGQYFVLKVLHQGRSSRTNALVGVGVVLAVSLSFLLDNPASDSSAYLIRGTSVFGDALGRLTTAIDLFWSAINRSDGIGLGAGIASQAVRYAGVDLSQHVGGAAESGIGYIALELGIVGVVIVAYLIFNMARVFFAKLRFLRDRDPTSLLYVASFLAYLSAQLATFVNATQLYGDYFVLITLGVIGGSIYSIVNETSRQVLISTLLKMDLLSAEKQAPSNE